MANQEKKEKKEPVEGILGTIGKIIPGFEGFFKKAEQTKTFGPQMKKIREEINRRFGKK